MLVFSGKNNNIITLTIHNGYTIPTTGSTDIVLHNGWNIIGTSVNGLIEGNNIGQIYQYDTVNNKYYVVTSLVANKGYLIKSNTNSNTITLSFNT